MSRREKRLRALQRLKEITLVHRNSCNVRWCDMESDSEGNPHVKHCPFCQLNVYDFSRLSPEAILDLLIAREGQLCAQCYVRADGTVILTDCDELQSRTFLRGGIEVIEAQKLRSLELEPERDRAGEKLNGNEGR